MDNPDHVIGELDEGTPLNMVASCSAILDGARDDPLAEGGNVIRRRAVTRDCGTAAPTLAAAAAALQGSTSEFARPNTLGVNRRSTASQTGGGESADSRSRRTSASLRGPTLAHFVWHELTRGYALHNDTDRYAEKRRKVYAFVQIPRELEKFLWFGFVQCLDAFLFVFTLLPLRFALAVAQLLTSPLVPVPDPVKDTVKCKRPCKMVWDCPLSGYALTPAQKCDLLKVVLLAASAALIQLVDTSALYHVVRGQAVIKLYIFFNMLEVADKLFSSFGQDILDALYWTATEPKSQRKYLPNLGTIPHLALAVIYVSLHTMLILFQATTLNVAFNSHNKALLTIMLSNNFVELKGSVFKKFAKSNLFQMACSDVRERFHLAVLVMFIVVRNMTAVQWAGEHLAEMLPDLSLVLFGELCVDWLKHAFITKFNEIPYEVYKDFSLTLAYDALRSRRIDAWSDHSDQVSRRMGFVPLSLAVLVIRIATTTVRTWDRPALALAALTYVCLLSLKVLACVLMLGFGTALSQYVDNYESMQQHAELLARLTNQKQSKSVPASPRLSLIDFTDVMGQTTSQHKGLTLSDLLSRLKLDADTISTGTGSHPPSVAASSAHKEREMSMPPKVVSRQQSRCVDAAQGHVTFPLESVAAGSLSGTPTTGMSRSRSFYYAEPKCEDKGSSGASQSPQLSPREKSGPPVAAVGAAPVAALLRDSLAEHNALDPSALLDNEPYRSMLDDAVGLVDTAPDLQPSGSAAATAPATPSAAAAADGAANPTNSQTATNGAAKGGPSPTKARKKLLSECESLQAVDRYTLLNDERIEI